MHEDDEVLKKLKAKEAAIAAQIAQRETRLNERKKKRDDRMKILVGAAMMEAAKRDSDLAARITREMDGFLTRDKERALFGLSPKA